MLHELKGHSSRVEEVAFSPDGKLLATGGNDNLVMLWDVKTGEHVNVLAELPERVCAIAFSPDSRVLASGDCLTFPGSLTCNIIFWDPKTSGSFANIPSDCSVSCMSYSPDGRFFVTGSSNGGLLTIYERVH